MSNCLAKWYPVWAKNARQSAEWLRSVDYIEWHNQRGIVPLNEIAREVKAKEYDSKALMWEQKAKTAR